MTQKTQPPDRIKPFYETPEPGKQLKLLKEDDATLKQGDTEVKGMVQITQEWSPMGLYWEFTGADFDAFAFDEVELEWKKVMAKGRLFSKGQHRVAGYIEGQVQVGSDHKLDRVTFHLPNYPDFIGKIDVHDEITDGTKKTSIRWNEVVLEVDDWRIRLQPYPEIFALRQKGREAQKVVLSGVGELRKADGLQFKKKEAKPILEALRIFLSFAFAEGQTVGTEHMMVAMLGARLMVCPLGPAVAHLSDKGSAFPFASGAPKAAKRLEIRR